MRTRLVPYLSGLATLLGASPLALAQNLPPVGAPCPAPGLTQPAQPTLPTIPAPTRPEMTSEMPAAPTMPFEATSLMPEASAAVGGESVALATPTMIGDLLGVPAIRNVRSRRTGRFESSIFPAAGHGFKIAENESPRPLDRIYANFNYFNNAFNAANRSFGGDVGRIDAYRGVLGAEKTLGASWMSLGVRVPFNFVHVSDTPTSSGVGGTDESLGDISVILKALVLENCEYGISVSVGGAVTFPTGPDIFAGHAGITDNVHDTLFQPFVAVLWECEDFYVQAFSSVDLPADRRDFTLMYNDVGVGYWLYRAASCRNRSGNAFTGTAPRPTFSGPDNAFGPNDCGYYCGHHFISAIVPTAELHVNTPLDHRANGINPLGLNDQLIVTGGVHFIFLDHTTLLLGASTPVTGPKPYDFEATAQFSVRF